MGGLPTQSPQQVDRLPLTYDKDTFVCTFYSLLAVEVNQSFSSGPGHVPVPATACLPTELFPW